MVVSGQDVEEPVVKIIAKDLPAVEARLRVGRGGHILASENERLPAGEKQALAHGLSRVADLDNVTSSPAVAGREFKFVEDIFLDSEIRSRLVQPVNKFIS